MILKVSEKYSQARIGDIELLHSCYTPLCQLLTPMLPVDSLQVGQLDYYIYIDLIVYKC